MKELLLYIARNLVDHPDEVVVNEIEKSDETVYELHVAPGDMGKVIGRQGKIAREIRVLMWDIRKTGVQISLPKSLTEWL